MENGQWNSTKFHAHNDVVASVAISTDGTRIASGSRVKTVEIWEEDNCQWNFTELRGNGDIIRLEMITTKGTHVVSCSDDKTLRLWQIKNHHYD